MSIQYKPLTDSFRELNRMIIEKQSWDAANKSRQAEIGLQGLIAQSQLKTASQQQKLTQYKIEEETRLRTPTDVNVDTFFQGGPRQKQGFMADPVWQDRVKRTVIDDPENWELDPADMRYKNKNTGQVYQMTPKQLQERMPFVYGFNNMHTDHVANAIESMGVLTQQIGEKSKEITEARKHPQTQASVVKLTKQKQMLVDKLRKANNALSPDNLIKHYKNKAAQLEQQAAALSAMGSPAASIFADGAKQAHADGRILLEGIVRNSTEALKAAVKTKDMGTQTIMAGKGGATYQGVTYSEGTKIPVSYDKATGFNLANYPGFVADLPEKPAEPSSPQKYYALRPTEYKGKMYDVGDELTVRFGPGQKEMSAPEGFSSRNPLESKDADKVTLIAQHDGVLDPITKQPVPVGTHMVIYPEKKGVLLPAVMYPGWDQRDPLKPDSSQKGMSASQALNIVADNVKTPGTYGQLTAASQIPAKKLASVWISQYAKQKGISPNGDFYPALAEYQATEQAAMEEYWTQQEYIDSVVDDQLLAEMQPKIIKKYKLSRGKTIEKDGEVVQKNIREFLEERNHKKFAKAFKDYLPEDYPVYKPSRQMHDQMEMGDY